MIFFGVTGVPSISTTTSPFWICLQCDAGAPVMTLSTTVSFTMRPTAAQIKVRRGFQHIGIDDLEYGVTLSLACCDQGRLLLEVQRFFHFGSYCC